jgi:hypothetical protein
MILPKDKAELEALLDPVVKWINNNVHPHTYLLVDNSGFKVLESQLNVVNEKHWTD